MKKSIYFFISAFILYLVSLIVIKIDGDFNYRWVIFVIYCLSLVLVFLASFNDLKFLEKIKNLSFLKKEPGLLLILIISFISRFTFLKSYPFVAIGDEVRDGGLLSSQIANGAVKNLHDWGPYQAFGMIIPTITGFFYLVFKNSVLTYRFPSAIISILDIIIIYFFVRKIFNHKNIAFLAALLIFASPLHLFYGRTEIVVILNSLLTTLIIIIFYNYLEIKNLKNILLLGLILGFSSGFHATVRPIIFVVILVFILLNIYLFFKEKRKKRSSFVVNIIFFIGSFLIGFGPRLLYTTPEIFFHLKRLPVLNNNLLTKTLFINNHFIKSLFNNYQQSISIYLNKSILYWGYPIFGTIIQSLVIPFFLLGFFYSLFFTKKLFFKILCLLIILIPLTNSAMTDIINGSHRLISLLPIVIILTATGFDQFFEFLDKFKIGYFIKNVLIISLSIYLVGECLMFFIKEKNSMGKHFPDFVSMYTIYFLKSYPYNNLCIYASPSNYDYSFLLHNQEKYQYFLPNKKIQWVRKTNLLDNEIYITKDCDFNTQFSLKEYCRIHKLFLCPTDNKSPIKLFFENNYQ